MGAEVNPYPSPLVPKRQIPIAWLSATGASDASQAKTDLGVISATESTEGLVELATQAESNDPTYSGSNVAQAKDLLLKRVGSALLVPDSSGNITGNTRGTGAVDFCRSRSADTQVASGNYAVNFGTHGTASGYVSTHFGRGGTASGYYSTHFGAYGTASVYFSTHFGRGGTASGYYSTHFGAYGTASGDYSTHFGYQGNASGGYSTHFGWSGNASGDYSTHFGYQGNASGGYSTHFGYNGTASGYYSTHFGYNGTASRDYSTHFGAYGTASGYFSTHFGWGGNASGGYSTHFGSNGTASGSFSTHFGYYGNASRYAQTVFSGGRFAATGDAQFSILTMRGATTDATPLILTSPEHFTIDDEKAYAITIDIMCRQDTGANHAFFKRQVLIERTAGTTALVGTVQTIGTDIVSSTQSTSITADDTNDRLQIQVTGIAATNLRWFASLHINEVGYSD